MSFGLVTYQEECGYLVGVVRSNSQLAVSIITLVLDD